MRDLGNRTVINTITLNGKEQEYPTQEPFVEYSLGELLNIWFRLMTKPKWRRSYEDEESLISINKIFEQPKFEFPKYRTRFFKN